MKILQSCFFTDLSWHVLLWFALSIQRYVSVDQDGTRIHGRGSADLVAAPLQ